MDVHINKDEKTVEWNVGEKIITIYNEHVLYAFTHGKHMLMIKERYDALKSGFSTYDKEGNLIFSFMYLGNHITFGEVDIDISNGTIIAADYEEEKRKLVILKETEERRSLLIYDEKGVLMAEIPSPEDYIFVSLKNNGHYSETPKDPNTGSIMVVAQGTNDKNSDSFGRNDWNFAIDFEFFYVRRKSITQ